MLITVSFDGEEKLRLILVSFLFPFVRSHIAFGEVGSGVVPFGWLALVLFREVTCVVLFEKCVGLCLAPIPQGGRSYVCSRAH